MSLQPPPIFSPIQDRASVILPIWQAFFVALQEEADALDSVPVLVTTSTPSLPNSVNLGALTTGMLKATIAAGIATLSSIAPAALTKTNDTNVTLTLGGTPASALLAATSLTLGWTGTLSAARGGTGVGSLAALRAALLPIVLTVDVSGTLPIANGGTNATVQMNSGICYFDSSKITSTANATLDGSGNATFGGTMAITGDTSITGLVRCGGPAVSARGLIAYGPTAGNIGLESYENAAVHGIYLRPNAGSSINMISSDFRSGGSYLPISLSGRETVTDLVMSTAGALRLGAYGAGALTTDASGNVTAVSDLRAKQQIAPFTAGLAAIRKLRPITFHWADWTGLDRARRYVAFGAQDVWPYLPDAVDVNRETGQFSLNQFVIIAALVNGVQAIADRIDALDEKREPVLSPLGSLAEFEHAIGLDRSKIHWNAPAVRFAGEA